MGPPLFDSEKIPSMLVDQFKNTATATGNTGQRVLCSNHGQAGFLHQQAIQVFQ